MSNSDSKEIKFEAGDTEELTDDMRVADLAATATPHKPFVKPTIKLEDTLTTEQIVAVSQLVREQTEKAVRAATFDPSRASQSVRKSVTPITDFSKLSLADVYDLSIPIEAKPFMSADVLSIKLKDTNYEARWVNKNPQRLGEMIGKGFTYITHEDLISVEGIKTALDAEDHYCFNDVVAMKIDKATYFAALRAAHLRAMSVTNSAGIAKKAATAANAYMNKSEFRNDFANASASKKMDFYDAGISI
jgi:hypothetical protein